MDVVGRNTTGVGIGLSSDKCVDLFVVEATGALNDTLTNPDIVIHNASSRVGLEDDTDGEAVLTRNERAELG